MKCDHVEDQLPFYVENELGRDERASVDAHLGTCETCRQSLAAYVQLEALLSERRSLAPPAARTAARVARRLGFSERRSILRALVSMPALLSSAFVAIGVLLILVGNPFRSVADHMPRSVRIETTSLFESLTQQLTTLGNLNEYFVLGVYLGVFAVIMLTGSWMVMRFVREQ